jgi:hypothetical protein
MLVGLTDKSANKQGLKNAQGTTTVVEPRDLVMNFKYKKKAPTLISSWISTRAKNQNPLVLCKSSKNLAEMAKIAEERRRGVTRRDRGRN